MSRGKFGGLLLGWLVLIFVMSHQPKAALPAYGVWDWLVKKGAHFVAYGVLAGLAYGALGKRGWALGLAVVYAVSDEWHQTFVPGRIGSLTDILIDTVGAVSSLLVLHWGREWLPRWAQTDRVAPP